MSYIHHYFRRLRWYEHGARMEETRSAYRIFMRKDLRNISPGRLRRRWEDISRWVLEK